MRRREAAALAALLFACCAAVPARAGYLLPPSAIELNSTEGQRLLRNASHTAAYAQLMNHFVTQARRARGARALGPGA